MSCETITIEGKPYARKKPGESFNSYACAFCRHLISYTTVTPNRAPCLRLVCVHCKRFGRDIPRRACPAFRKARQPKRMGWRK